MQDFLKQRLFPEFESGYYKSLIKNPKEMTQNMMKIRDSSLVFRTSSQGSSMEGLQVDFLSLDEYDRLNPMAEQSGIESQKSSKYKMLRRWSTPKTVGARFSNKSRINPVKRVKLNNNYNKE